MKNIYLTPIIIFLFGHFVLCQGTLTTDSLFSEALGQYDHYQIYLPEGYNADIEEGYPTIYFLHGSFNDHTTYGYIVPILDSLIANELMAPTIVVKPNGSQGPYNASMYTNSVLNGNVEDFIIQDLIPHIDDTYNTRNEKQFRCIMGHSMGADGSSRLALTYPDLFRAFASHSGAPDINRFDLVLDWILFNSFPDTPPPYDYQPAGWSIFLFIASSGWSPNLDNEPYQVDLPVDEYGFPVDSILDVWSQFTAAQIVAKNPFPEELDIYVDCGIQDQFQFFPLNEGLRDTLEKYSIPHTFQAYDGGHTDQLQERFPISLQFLDSVMNAEVTGVEQLRGLVDKIMVFPNPSIDQLTLQLELKKRAEISIFLSDLSGRMIKVLAKKRHLTHGNHQLTFDIKDLSPGQYHISIKNEGEVVSKKVLLQN